MSEFSAYLGRDFFTICDLISVIIFPKSNRRFYDKKKYVNRLLKQLIITDYIESVNGLKSVCPICVESRRLSRNVTDTRMRRNNVKKVY